MQIAKRITRRIIVGAFVGALLILVPLFSILNTKKASEKLSGGVQNYEGEFPPDGYSVQVNVSSFNPALGVVSLHFVIYNLANQNLIPATNSSLLLLANSKSQNFSRFDNVPQTDITYSVISSTSNNYPFDSYIIEGTFELIDSSSAVVSNTYLLASIDQWSVDASVEGGQEDFRTVVMTMVFKRNQIIQFFALFIGSLMWALSLSALILSSTIWTRNRKVEPPTIAVVGALLFALPAMRNGLPGSPALGVTFDVASYFWTLLIVAVSVIMLMWNYIVMYQSEKKQTGVEKTELDLDTPFLSR